MQLDTGFSCNSVIWLTSLPDSELGPTRRMVEDMGSLKAEMCIGFKHIQVTSAAHLKSLLEELSCHASENGMRPLLHFDMHGNKEEGLHISQASEMEIEDIHQNSEYDGCPRTKNEKRDSAPRDKLWRSRKYRLSMEISAEIWGAES